MPTITSDNPNIKWCQVSERNNFKFANKLLKANSIKQTLEVWSKISEFDISSNIDKKISFFASISSQNYKKDIYEVLKCFPHLETYCSAILKNYASVNFEYLQDLSSNEITKAKHKELKKIIKKMNKQILITGGAQRIGKELVNHFHNAGWNVIFQYRSSSDSANELCDQLNKKREQFLSNFSV